LLFWEFIIKQMLFIAQFDAAKVGECGASVKNAQPKVGRFY